jgi:hypothetical protein
MISWNRQNLAWVVAIRLVKALAIMVLFVRTIDNVTQVEEKRRIQPAASRVVVGGHLLGDLLGLFGVVDAAIPDRMHSNLANVLDLFAAVLADDVSQRHPAVALSGIYRTKVQLAPVGHPRQTLERRALTRRRWQEEWMSETLRGISGGIVKFCDRHSYPLV